MPLLLVPDTDVERVQLPVDGEWVDVKRRFGTDDDREVTRLILNVRRIRSDEMGADLGNIELGAGDIIDLAKFAKMQVAIKAWSFDAPITHRTVRALDDASVDVIAARLEELYGTPRSDDDRKNSSEPGAQPSEPADDSRPSSAG